MGRFFGNRRAVTRPSSGVLLPSVGPFQGFSKNSGTLPNKTFSLITQTINTPSITGALVANNVLFTYGGGPLPTATDSVIVRAVTIQFTGSTSPLDVTGQDGFSGADFGGGSFWVGGNGGNGGGNGLGGAADDGSGGGIPGSDGFAFGPNFANGCSPLYTIPNGPDSLGLAGGPGYGAGGSPQAQVIAAPAAAGGSGGGGGFICLVGISITSPGAVRTLRSGFSGGGGPDGAAENGVQGLPGVILVFAKKYDGNLIANVSDGNEQTGVAQLWEIAHDGVTLTDHSSSWTDVWDNR